jgi:conjugal transfer pilus assembly protein TraW
MNVHPKPLVLAVLSATLLGAAYASPACAKDFGVVAQVWPITERDIREIVAEQSSQVDWGSVNKQVVESGKTFLNRLPRRNLAQATQLETKYIDPSIVLNSDVKVPVKTASGYEWQIAYKAGERVNTLAKIRPATAMLYFDGRDPEQVEFAKDLASDIHYRVVPIEASGEDFPGVLKSFNRPVFFASQVQLTRFAVDKLPALVYPASGKYALFIANTVFPKPYRVNQVTALWPGPADGAGVGYAPTSAQSGGAPQVVTVPGAKK